MWLTNSQGHVFTYRSGPSEWWKFPTIRIQPTINWHAFFVTMSAVDTALDIFALSMPWPLLKQLHLDRKKMAQVSVFFLLGALYKIQTINLYRKLISLQLRYSIRCPNVIPYPRFTKSSIYI